MVQNQVKHKSEVTKKNFKQIVRTKVLHELKPEEPERQLWQRCSC